MNHGRCRASGGHEVHTRHAGRKLTITPLAAVPIVSGTPRQPVVDQARFCEGCFLQGEIGNQNANHNNRFGCDGRKPHPMA